MNCNREEKKRIILALLCLSVDVCQRINAIKKPSWIISYSYLVQGKSFMIHNKDFILVLIIIC